MILFDFVMAFILALFRHGSAQFTVLSLALIINFVAIYIIHTSKAIHLCVCVRILFYSHELNLVLQHFYTVWKWRSPFNMYTLNYIGWQ